MSDDQANRNQPQIAGSIDYPASTTPVTVNTQQPRPPRNLQDLLRYATEAGAGAAGPSAPTLPMDEESKQFLTECLASMSMDVASELRAGIESIEKCIVSPHFEEDDCDEAFDKILNLIGKIDFANDFHKLGGFRIFTPCITSDAPQLRWRCCELIAELCQNNPYCQEKCVVEGYLPKLASLVDEDYSDIVRIKAMYAISCLVRESDAALKEFKANDGFSVILRALQFESDKLKIKSSFLLSSLCAKTPEVKGDLVSMGFVEQMIGLIIQNKSSYNIVEHLLSALSSIVNDCPDAQHVCRRPDLQLQSILDSIAEDAKGKDSAREVVEYTKSIEQFVFSGGDNQSFEEDR